MEIIKFDKKDLLTFDDIEKLIISVRPNEKAQLLSSKLLNYLLINNGDFYRFDNEKVLYIQEDNDDAYVLTLITLFIDQSYAALPQLQQDNLQLKYKKSYDKIFCNSDVNKYLPQLLTNLTNNKVDFSDPHLYQIHFKNGFWNFKTGAFEKRIKGKDFINVHIKRDYKAPTQSDIKRVMKDIVKIYPNTDDRNYLMMSYGIAITGQACSDQTILFLLGLGSSGKSTMLDICKLSLEDYVFTLPKQTFSKGFTKIDKILNTYAKKPYIRISYINEPEDTRIDDSLFKDHCDGNIQTTSLYKDGSNDFKHYSKMVIGANTFPNIKCDSGTVRRIDSYTHSSKFTKDKSIVNETANIFYANTNFKTEITNDDKYLNAFFHIIAEYGYDWIRKVNVYKQTENFRDTKTAIISSNDTIQDFIDRNIIITGKDKDRVSRDTMFEAFKSFSPKSFITPTQLLNSLKQKEIQYNPNYRLNSLRGCYTGIELGCDDNKLDDNNPLDSGIEKIDYKTKYEKLLQELKDLKEQSNKEIDLELEDNIDQLSKELDNFI